MAPQAPYGKLWITSDGTIYRALLPRQQGDTLSKTARDAHRNQKWSATGKGVGFWLTFEQWWKIWQDSGHWQERGPLPHQFCMARGTPRRPDTGSYKLGNVRIITNKQNRSEQDISYLRGNQHARGSKHTKAWKQEKSKQMKGNHHHARLRPEDVRGIRKLLKKGTMTKNEIAFMYYNVSVAAITDIQLGRTWKDVK